MQLFPQNDILRKHISHYWVVKDTKLVFPKDQLLYAYPGITPELILVLDGSFTYKYLGEEHMVNKSMLFGFIHKDLIFNHNNLKSFILIQFQSRALSSIMPFVSNNPENLIKNPICEGNVVFGKEINLLLDKLKHMDSDRITECLDYFFLSHYKEDNNDIVSELFEAIKKQKPLKEVIEKNAYSYSTLERQIKKSTGLSPKKFQSLMRYKLAVQEIYDTRNEDWMHYVEKYNYFDQSHFIKEIKRYTSFTPKQLLDQPALPDFRRI